MKLLREERFYRTDCEANANKVTVAVRIKNVPSLVFIKRSSANDIILETSITSVQTSLALVVWNLQRNACYLPPRAFGILGSFLRSDNVRIFRKYLEKDDDVKRHFDMYMHMTPHKYNLYTQGAFVMNVQNISKSPMGGSFRKSTLPRGTVWLVNRNALKVETWSVFKKYRMHLTSSGSGRGNTLEEAVFSKQGHHYLVLEDIEDAARRGGLPAVCAYVAKQTNGWYVLPIRNRVHFDGFAFPSLYGLHFWASHVGNVQRVGGRTRRRRRKMGRPLLTTRALDTDHTDSSAAHPHSVLARLQTTDSRRALANGWCCE